MNTNKFEYPRFFEYPLILVPQILSINKFLAPTHFEYPQNSTFENMYPQLSNTHKFLVHANLKF